MILRIDIYLKLTGVFKTRTIAGKACRSGLVYLNGKEAASSSGVEAQDIIKVTAFPDTAVFYEVLAIPAAKQVSRKERPSYIRRLAGAE